MGWCSKRKDSGKPENSGCFRGKHSYSHSIFIGVVNDDAENMEATARFIASLTGDKKQANLLPYHKIAQTKYRKLGRPDEFRLFQESRKNVIQEALSIFEK